MKIYGYNGKRNIVGSRVREARRRLGLSQEELAARLQVEAVTLEQKTISRLEQGQRIVTDYEVKVLARILKVDPNWLLEEGWKYFRCEENCAILKLEVRRFS